MPRSPELKFDEIGYWSEIKLDLIKEYAKKYSEILTAQERWAVGQLSQSNKGGETWHPAVYKTKDGGNNWHQVFNGPANPYPLWDVWPASPKIIWAVGVYILYSEDGGESQYLSQLDHQVQDAILGNVGTVISFRIGISDAEVLGKEFYPEFSTRDLIALPNYHIYLKLMINGIISNPFSAATYKC